MTGALDGLRVLDLSRILAGPTATQLLGDFGADIIKVERPGLGDETRAWGPPFVEGVDGPTQESAYYLCANRNKRSIALDIATPEGAQKVRDLLATCDVLIENFKPGGLDKYGLSYADLKDAFPKLVYCSISGFGQTGPNREKPGYDLLAQAYGGIMSLTGEPEGEPMKTAVGIADVMTGMYASNAILAALRHRDNSGEGQQIDIALVDCQIAWLINEGTNYLTSKNIPTRRGNQHPNIVPYQVFQMADGHAVVAVGNDAQFGRFCTLIGREELANDPQYATNAARLVNRDALIATLSDTLAGLGRDWLISGMEANKIPGGPINRLDDVFESDQVAAREMKIAMPHASAATGSVDLIGNPVKFSKTPATYRRAPPICGADTDDILAELAATQKD
ncbi:Crotonobetainyl-CoA:carnitine CoA-transferase CaiB [Octadecabacter temperatus]|uniref:Formyl-coenzyme A transferase n=1 Tax=Octadecabacter temperatus TaxID=1458307 RepID=A0A0K0Y575_9RHOB|nr:CoA transferase [Octadecabacter temperatus]AKS46138.1 Formyl-coenzyme A transferase [Octadecabacter temperatus]SIO08253.1 Crotonobetainyl-CoA:carnitine CoA-transferase CaiB [Octadecabacter temperatus]